MNINKIVSSIFLFFCLIALILGFVQVNLTNTKALSPFGNSNKNYKLVNEEFEGEFENFIKDNSSVKIYKQDSGGFLVRLDELGDYRVTTETTFMENLKGIGDELKGTLSDMKEFFKGLTD